MFYYYQCGIIYFNIVIFLSIKVVFIVKPCITEQSGQRRFFLGLVLESFPQICPALQPRFLLYSHANTNCSFVDRFLSSPFLHVHPMPSRLVAKTAQHGLLLPKTTECVELLPFFPTSQLQGFSSGLLT